jgi:hypothetical protein
MASRIAALLSMLSLSRPLLYVCIFDVIALPSRWSFECDGEFEGAFEDDEVDEDDKDEEFPETCKPKASISIMTERPLAMSCIIDTPVLARSDVGTST